MNKALEFTSYIFLILAATIAGGLFTSYLIEGNMKFLVRDNPCCVNDLNYSMNLTGNDFIFFTEASNRFALAHKYDVDLYDCKNYSYDFYVTMKNLGFDVNIEIGFKENGSGHAWNSVRLNLEPQSGEFVNQAYIYPRPSPREFIERREENGFTK